MKPENITIIGSTGSIGQQTIDVIRAHPERFRVFALAVNQNIKDLLIQIEEFHPKIVAIYHSLEAKKLKKELEKLPLKIRPQVFSGKSGWEKVSTHPQTQKIVFASSGLKGLSSLLQAIRSQKLIALANKEVIVAEGKKIMALAKKNHVTIVPIDSEHSAIFQCLQGEDSKNIEKIILTCSGGPFYGKTRSELAKVTIAQALAHPTWKMSPKISIDSATLINKGFELIEAKYFFDIDESKIEIMIHPESTVHSLVLFKDGNVKAQLSVPNMRTHIAYALAYPERLTMELPRLDLLQLQKLTFLKPDFSIFRGPVIIREALKKGKKALRSVIYTNDKAVDKFLAGEIQFLDIFDQIKS